MICWKLSLLSDGFSFMYAYLDMDKVEAANCLCNTQFSQDRNDALTDQIPGWRFDNRKPCLV
ncbi:MAG: hypothetical protein IKK34_11010 [Clostridia bacterium]|nr:hypothetical protein [Clostridia bacterium]